MENNPLVTETYDRVQVVRMNDVANRNALSSELKSAMKAEIDEFNRNPDLRCLIITGTDSIFCAGGDLRTLTHDSKPVDARTRMSNTQRLITSIATSDKPVIMAINGAAVGGGFSWALGGDLAIASQDAYFLPAFGKVGALPDFGILYHLPQAVGMKRAKDILFTNRRINATEALEMGLVSRVLPQSGFLDHVIALAQDMAKNAPVSIGLAKTLLGSSVGASLSEFFAQEALAQAVAFSTEDFAEGNAAFREKRKPQFVGR